VLQAKQQNQPTKIRNEEGQTMPVLIQMLKLPRGSSSGLQCLFILVTQIQQGLADEEILGDL